MENQKTNQKPNQKGARNNMSRPTFSEFRMKKLVKMGVRYFTEHGIPRDIFLENYYKNLNEMTPVEQALYVVNDWKEYVKE